jgi:hypothetical protein
MSTFLIGKPLEHSTSQGVIVDVKSASSVIHGDDVLEMRHNNRIH